jgi:hypothetical protein
VRRSCLATPASRSAAITRCALAAFAVTAAWAVAAVELTPNEKPARFGTASTLPLPLTFTLRVLGDEPCAGSGLPTPA